MVMAVFLKETFDFIVVVKSLINIIKEKDSDIFIFSKIKAIKISRKSVFLIKI